MASKGRQQWRDAPASHPGFPIPVGAEDLSSDEWLTQCGGSRHGFRESPALVVAGYHRLPRVGDTTASLATSAGAMPRWLELDGSGSAAVSAGHGDRLARVRQYESSIFVATVISGVRLSLCRCGARPEA